MALPAQRSEIEANLMHADWFASQGMTAQAAALYRTAGMKAEQQGNLRSAASAYAAVARFEGPGSDARVRLAELQLMLGRPKEAAATFEAASVEAFGAGRVPLGLSALRRAADAQPTADRWLRLRDWCLHLGRTDEAIGHLKEAVAGLFQHEEPEPFIAVAKALLALVPDDLSTLRRLVRAHLKRRDLHGAVAALQSLLRLRPGDPDALECMADAFAALGRKDKAAEVVARLARGLASQGMHARAEARRLAYRGLAWAPGHRELLELSRRLSDRPRAVARELVVPPSMPALDMAQFAEAALQPPPTRQETVALDISELEMLEELSGVRRAPIR